MTSFRDYLSASAATIKQAMRGTFDGAVAETLRRAPDLDADRRDPLPICKSRGEVFLRLQARNKGRSSLMPGLCRRHVYGGRRIAFMVVGGVKYALHATKGWRRMGAH